MSTADSSVIRVGTSISEWPPNDSGKGLKCHQTTDLEALSSTADRGNRTLGCGVVRREGRLGAVMAEAQRAATFEEFYRALL
jgi:hypothetical protein